MRIMLVLLVLLVCVGAAALALAEDAPSKAGAEPPTLADLAWLQGRWVDAGGKSVFSEYWGAPQGDAMAGLAHWTYAGTTRVFELMAIEQTPQGPVLRIRHFNRGLVPWAAEKGGPISWPLKSLEGQSVVFEHPTRAWPKRMEYRRTGDRLKGTLSGVEKGTPKSIPFDFERSK